MITTAVIGAACLALGLYSGKKRAKGEGWSEITSDLWNDTCHNVKMAWGKVSSPFKMEEPFDDPE